MREAYRLLEIEDEDLEAYTLTEQQKNTVNEAREEVPKGNFLTDDEANNAIDEWLESNLVSASASGSKRNTTLLAQPK